VSLSLVHFVRPGAAPGLITFPDESFQANTWVLEPAVAAFGHAVDVSVNADEKKIELAALKSLPELAGANALSRIQAEAFCWEAGSPAWDSTADSAAGSVTGPQGDAPYGVIDIMGCALYDTATLVTLSSFEVCPLFIGSMAVFWATESEVDNAGFNLYGADSPGGPWVQINTGLIPAKGSATRGGAVCVSGQRG